MIINKFSINWEFGNNSELDEFELEKIEELGIEEIWYCYSFGRPGGYGSLIMRKGNLFGYQSLNHSNDFEPLFGLCFQALPFDILKSNLGEYSYAKASELIFDIKSKLSNFTI